MPKDSGSHLLSDAEGAVLKRLNSLIRLIINKKEYNMTKKSMLLSLTFTFVLTFMILSISSNAASFSPALEVISHNMQMDVSVISGNTLSLSEEIFKKELGTSFINKAQILSLPAEDFGILVCDEKTLSVGDSLSPSQLDSLSFIPTEINKSSNEICLKVSSCGIDYTVSCRIHILDRLNFSPVTNQENEALEVFSGVCSWGILSGFDPEGDEVCFEICSYPKKGTLTLTDSKKGKYVYFPRKNAEGRDSFEYTVKDEYGGRSAVCRVDINLNSDDEDIIYSDLTLDPSAHSAAVLSKLGIFKGEQFGGDYTFSPQKTMVTEDFLRIALTYLGISPTPSEQLCDHPFTQCAVNLGVLPSELDPEAVPLLCDASSIIEKLIHRHTNEDEYVFAPSDDPSGALNRLCNAYPTLFIDISLSNSPLTRSNAASLVVNCLSAKHSVSTS